MVKLAASLVLLGAVVSAHTYSTHKRVENEYPQLAVHHHVRAAGHAAAPKADQHRHAAAPHKQPAKHDSHAPRPVAWAAPAPTPNANDAISAALMNPHMNVAGDEFSTLLLSAIESNNGNMPVISV
ncbi:hypothetical protein LPJ70_005796 [Coemansia sp. RSA 2708]|nr:hypothetical protein LPJ70_005796 [Coemansia sp. RSA 2708]KAJ2366932.1 hypothetical protein H4S01_002439 [Coemansia sp. RSA 2610]